MSVVKINAITVPRERFAEFERRFAARAGHVTGAPGFEAFHEQTVRFGLVAGLPTISSLAAR